MKSNTASKDWMKTTNVYEVNLRQYTREGTFKAFSKELPRLRDMGVETLWFMPITPIAQKLKKGSMGSYYAAADYTSINPEFGTLAEFKKLVKDAHKKGFRIIIDWVANHTGWDHVWTTEHPEYYKQDLETGTFKRASGMDDIIELDFGNVEMRRDMINAMRFWVEETGIDGFRCDLAFWVPLDFWVEAKLAVSTTQELFWLGELDPLEHPDYMNVFDVAYAWTWMHKTEEFYKNHYPLETLLEVLKRYQQVQPMQAWFTSNHDENSWNGTEYEKYGEAAKAFAVFSCTWPGIPLVYSGQELPNRKRLAFFEKDQIDWSGTNELHDFYKVLLNLHKNHPALKGVAKDAPLLYIHTSTPAHVLAYLRTSGKRQVAVFLNFSSGDVYPIINDAHLSGEFTNVFTKSTIDFDKENSIFLKSWEYLVFEK